VAIAVRPIEACIDLVRGWPDAATAVIGLLLEPAARGKGIGRIAFNAIEAQARAGPEIERLRAVVIEPENAVARPFWEKMGFRATGQTRPHEAGTVRSTAIVLVKALHR
jgi:GNAT superfamily N-acetyltransferase